MREVDVALRFQHEFEENIVQFRTKIINKLESLVRSNKKVLEEMKKNVEYARGLMQQNTVYKDEMKEIWKKVNEAEKQIEEEEMTRRIRRTFEQYITEIYQQIVQIYRNLLQQQLPNVDQQQGLSPRRIQRFHLFTADSTFLGQQCGICLEDIVGRRMRRVTCNGNHAFCQSCCETWFANNNTCPLCRHVFV